MSGSPRRSTWTGGRRGAFAVLSVALATIAVVHYRRDRALRVPAEAFAREFSVDRRFPLEVAAIAIEPSGDLACAMAVDAALRDERSSSPSVRGADDRRREMAEASRLMARALAVRPGWGIHHYLLGQTAVRLSLPSGPADAGRWEEPLRMASLAAPGLDAIAVARAAAYLDRWPVLDTVTRVSAPGVLRRAFLDPEFVERRLPGAISTFGAGGALQLLPGTEAPLKAAVKPMSASGDVAAIGTLYERLIRAENAELADWVRKAEQRQRLGDVAGRASACWNWLSRHSVYDFDDREGRARLSRLLELCTRDAGGTWNADPRSELVGYFLNGREKEVDPEALARAMDGFAAVPASVRTRGRILAGDGPGAIEIVDQSATDGFEWTPVFVELARLELSRGDAAQGRALLDRIPFGSRDGCDVLLARREIARALGDPRDLEVSQQLLDRAMPGGPRDAWSSGGTLAVCLDPARIGGRVLAVATQSDADAVASYGWDGGRAGILRIRAGQESLRIPVPVSGGSRSLTVRTLAGGPVRLGRVGLQPAT